MHQHTGNLKTGICIQQNIPPKLPHPINRTSMKGDEMTCFQSCQNDELFFSMEGLINSVVTKTTIQRQSPCCVHTHITILPLFGSDFKRPVFIRLKLQNYLQFSNSGYFPEAHNCVFTRTIRSSQTSSEGRKVATISPKAGYFGNKTNVSQEIFSTKQLANCNCGLMKSQIKWLICDS